MNDLAKNIILWVIIAFILMTVFKHLSGPSNTGEINYSEFLTEVQDQGIASVTINGRVLTGKKKDGNPFVTYSPETDNRSLVGELQKSGVVIKAEPPDQGLPTCC